MRLISMLSAEDFIHDYYQEQLSNWRSTENLELGEIVSEISSELLKNLNNMKYVVLYLIT